MLSSTKKIRSGPSPAITSASIRRVCSSRTVSEPSVKIFSAVTGLSGWRWLYWVTAASRVLVWMASASV